MHELREGICLICTEIFSQLKMRHVIIIAINFCTKVVSNYICQCLCVCVCVCVCVWKSEVKEMENIIYQVFLRKKQE